MYSDSCKDLQKNCPRKMPPHILLRSGQANQHAERQKCLKEQNIVQSMSRKGNCMNNGVIENFFGQLKAEMRYGVKFASVEYFLQKLHEYIFYLNNNKISLSLNRMSPVQYRSLPNDLIKFCPNFGIRFTIRGSSLYKKAILLTKASLKTRLITFIYIKISNDNIFVHI